MQRLPFWLEKTKFRGRTSTCRKGRHGVREVAQIKNKDLSPVYHRQGWSGVAQMGSFFGLTAVHLGFTQYISPW